MDYKGVRTKTETYISGPPKTDDELIICYSCDNKEECYSQANMSGRTATISYYLLPHIDETDPPMSKRFKAIMTKRPSVERTSRGELDLGIFFFGNHLSYSVIIFISVIQVQTMRTNLPPYSLDTPAYSLFCLVKFFSLHIVRHSALYKKEQCGVCSKDCRKFITKRGQL